MGQVVFGLGAWRHSTLPSGDTLHRVAVSSAEMDDSGRELHPSSVRRVRVQKGVHWP